MDKKTSGLEMLAAHALKTMPDSRRESASLLLSVVALLPKGHELRTAAQTQLHLMRQMDKFQQQFQLEFPGGAA
jgi:hypothetical protein